MTPEELEGHRDNVKAGKDELENRLGEAQTVSFAEIDSKKIQTACESLKKMAQYFYSPNELASPDLFHRKAPTVNDLTRELEFKLAGRKEFTRKDLESIKYHQATLSQSCKTKIATAPKDSRTDFDSDLTTQR